MYDIVWFLIIQDLIYHSRYDKLLSDPCYQFLSFVQMSYVLAYALVKFLQMKNPIINSKKRLPLSPECVSNPAMPSYKKRQDVHYV